MKKVYYAHAMCLYGEPEEHQELAQIKRKFRGSRIVNPADYDGHPDKRRNGVRFCLRLIEGCDIVVFSRLLGKVTAGVGKEVNHALKIGKPVFELAQGRFIRHTRPVKYISRPATINLYERWRAL
ncbi:MAG: nucleoside 2-deoxyribosyltransferase [Acidobacteriia bacterium]|jgi:hypothetical protein|nr:nucleoside 2-deoxyribosyltransferase [Terriglobia bacterium]